jgi:F0F1-type ATP synthase assembly protein I
MLAIPAFFYEVIMRSHQMTHELYVTRIASSILSLVVLIIAGYYIGVVGIIISRIINAGSLSLIGFLLLSRKLKE